MIRRALWPGCRSTASWCAPGKENSVAATKTYTGQVLMFYLLAKALGAPIVLDDLNRLPEWTNEALGLEKVIAQRAERYSFMRQTAVVGRGLNYSNAFEFALKMMETCYVVAERFSSADFLHGPIAMIETAFPVFLFAPCGPTWASTAEMLEKLKSLGGETLVITDKSNQQAARLANRAITVPVRLATKSRLPADLFTPIPYIVPAQLFAACLAVEKGLNPDQAPDA